MALNIKDNFYFLTSQNELSPVFKRVNLILRLIYIDTYCISVAEAIFLDIPAIASDTCKTRKGTVLVKNRDIDDLYTKTVGVIENYEEYKNKVKNMKLRRS